MHSYGVRRGSSSLVWPGFFSRLAARPDRCVAAALGPLATVLRQSLVSTLCLVPVLACDVAPSGSLVESGREKIRDLSTPDAPPDPIRATTDGGPADLSAESSIDGKPGDDTLGGEADSAQAADAGGPERPKTTDPAEQPRSGACATMDYTTKKSGKVVKVTDAASFSAAMERASAGDVVQLSAGNYGWIDLRDKRYDDYVTIRGAEGATFKHLGLDKCMNVQVEDVDFVYGDATADNNPPDGKTPWQPKIIEVLNSENVRIVGVSVIGNPKAKAYDDEIPNTGIRFTDCKNVAIVNSAISKVSRAVLTQVVRGYVYENNTFTDLGCDGFLSQQTHEGVFQNNYIGSSMHHNAGPCHADYVQFDAGKDRHDEQPDTDIVIRGNVFLQGKNGSQCSEGSECGATQGPFLGGAVCLTSRGVPHWYENFVIEHNVYCASGKNGITAACGKNIVVRNNAHYTCPPPFGEKHLSGIYWKGEMKDSKIENNETGRVSGQEEAIVKAKGLSWLKNCRLKQL